MKLFTVLGLLALLACVVAWTKEDHEIFDLVSALESAEGKGTTFYSFLGVPPQAQLKDINRQYRKRSLDLHPDKNPNTKDIHARFARLGTITEILRDPTKRTRYDFFFKNGVPKWRGTGYYYSRFRPSVVHVLFFLVLISSLIHYLILRVNYRRDQQRIDYFTRSALARAGGNGALTSGTATPTNDTGSSLDDEKDGVLASIVDQVTNSSDRMDSAAPLMSKRQAKIQAREAKRDKNKRDASVTVPVSGTATPVPSAPASRRRKVRVPMIDGAENSPSLDLVVVDGEPDGAELTPLTTLARPPSWHALWPVAFYDSILANFRKSEADLGGSDNDEEGSAEDNDIVDADANADGSSSAPKPKRKPAAGGKVAAMRRRKATLK